MSALATAIAFPINLTAGFVCLGITVGSFAINGVNYLIYDKVDSVFYEKIRKTNEKINVSATAINYPNAEKRVSVIFHNKGPIVVEEDKAFDVAIEIMNSEKPKQEKVSIAENGSYLRENFNEILEETNNTL